MEYTAVIRTLGTAGDKYQQLLDSLNRQTIKPSEIIVYIADGYALPKQTIGKERYVYIKKGMVAQRALRYDEVKTEYILFLDDDVFLPPTAVEILYRELNEMQGDVISPDVFPNDKRPIKAEIMMTLSGRMRARRGDDEWGYKVMRTGGYSYNKNPQKSVYRSQTNAGPCFFCRKEFFLRIKFEEELWLDKQKYPLGEDQVMYYKMHLKGFKVLTSFDSGIVHLDAGSCRVSEEKEHKIIYSDYFFKMIFWHRFIQLPEKNCIMRLWNKICIGYFLLFGLIVSFIKGEWDVLRIKKQAIGDANAFLKSEEYHRLPKIERL